MSDPIIITTKIGEQDASTLLWNGGYVLPAGANFFLGFIVLILGHTIGRQIKAGPKVKWFDKIVQYANASSVTTMALTFLLFSMGCTLVYSGLFGPANLMSLHFDPLAAGVGDITQWFVVNALPKIGSSQYNFYHWIFPVIAVLLTHPLVLVATSYFQGFESSAANTIGFTGLIITLLNILTYTHPNTTGWYLYIIGAMLLTLFDAYMSYAARENGGPVTYIAPFVPIVYEGAILIILGVGSYSTAKYTMDVTYIWLQCVLTFLCIVFSLFFAFAGKFKVAKATAAETAANKAKSSKSASFGGSTSKN